MRATKAWGGAVWAMVVGALTLGAMTGGAMRAEAATRHRTHKTPSAAAAVVRPAGAPVASVLVLPVPAAADRATTPAGKAAVNPIPTLDDAGLLALAGVLAVAGVGLLRRP